MSEEKRAEGPEWVTHFWDPKYGWLDDYWTKAGEQEAETAGMVRVDYVRADVVSRLEAELAEARRLTVGARDHAIARIKEFEAELAEVKEKREASEEEYRLFRNDARRELEEAKSANGRLRVSFEQLCGVADVKDQGHLGFDQDLYRLEQRLKVADEAKAEIERLRHVEATWLGVLEKAHNLDAIQGEVAKALSISQEQAEVAKRALEGPNAALLYWRELAELAIAVHADDEKEIERLRARETEVLELAVKAIDPKGNWDDPDIVDGLRWGQEQIRKLLEAK